MTRKKNSVSTQDHSRRNVTIMSMQRAPDQVDPAESHPASHANSFNNHQSPPPMRESSSPIPYKSSYPKDLSPHQQDIDLESQSNQEDQDQDKKQKKGKSPRCVGFLRFILVLGNFFMLAIGSMMVAAGIMMRSNTDLMAESLYNLLHLAALVIGCTLILSSVFGMATTCSGNKPLATIFIILMLATIACQVYFTITLNYGLVQATDRPGSYWDLIPDQYKAIAQQRGNCCGFKSIDDRPFTPCPVDATLGCGDNVSKGLAQSQKILYTFIASSIAGELLLIILISIVSFRRK